MTRRWRAKGRAGNAVIGDYGLIGDTHTAALVGRDGSVDWVCLPRFDAGACFAALLGEPGHGRDAAVLMIPLVGFLPATDEPGRRGPFEAQCAMERAIS